MYSLKRVDGKEKKIGKGVNSAVVENVKHKEYLDVLLNIGVVRQKIKRIQRKLNKFGT